MDHEVKLKGAVARALTQMTAQERLAVEDTAVSMKQHNSKAADSSGQSIIRALALGLSAAYPRMSTEYIEVVIRSVARAARVRGVVSTSQEQP